MASPRSAFGAPPRGGRRQLPGKAGSAVAAWLVVLAGLPSPALAQSVSLQGSLGANKALLVIDGQPQTLAVGATARGVTLRRLVEGEAEVEVGGQVRSLRLGEAPSRVGSGGAAPGTGGSIVLPKASGGHFHATGSINGKTVQFMVDTGATTIALGRSEADRIGLDWKHGRPGMTQTANGTVPVHGVTLASVRVGDVVVTNIAAVVVPMDMSTVLLGNSFLDRFNMRRENDVMRLDLKR